jgi:hypothetical protein
VDPKVKVQKSAFGKILIKEKKIVEKLKRFKRVRDRTDVMNK